MNKRAFLNIVSTAIAGRAIAPLAALAEKEKLTNWSGNIVYGTERVSEAGSAEQVKAALRAGKVKVQGSRHCFNTIADSRDSLLTLAAKLEATEFDAKARTVTVDASIKYGQLAPLLDSKGFALHNLASLPHISIAGACATATHGSGEKNGNLASAVAGIEMVTGTGDVVKLSRHADGEAFRAAVVGLGALGIVTRVTLDAQPAYRMRQYVYENLPMAAVRDHFDQIQASGYSVSLFTDWQGGRVRELWIKSRDGGSHEFAAPPELFGAKLAKRDLHPIAEISPENCTPQMGVPGPWYERLPHFRMGFTPSAGKELQSEYLLPRRHAVEAIQAVERLRDQVSPLLLISEIRTVAADDLWMSTCYRQDSVAIHFTWKPDWPGVKQVLPVIEKELSAFGARPHWGKLFIARPRYERGEEFVKLAKRYDLQGKFRNEFLTKYVFGA